MTGSNVRNQLMIWRRLAFLASVSLCVALPAAAHGANQGIGLSPTSQEVALDPGQSKTGEITVINDGDRDVNYTIDATDYKVINEGYQGNFDSSQKAANVSPVSWFTLPKGTFTVKSRTEITFPYTVTAPRTATPGGHYAAIFIQTIPPAAQGQAYVQRIERVGSLFYLSVSGDLKLSGQLLPLSVPRLQSTSPVKATVRLSNDGNVHFLAQGTVQLSNPFGNVGKPLPFRGEVLPGTTRRFSFDLPATSPIGLYKVTASVKYLDKNEIVTQWMLLMPRLTFIIISLTILALLAFWIGRMVRRIRRRQKRLK